MKLKELNLNFNIDQNTNLNKKYIQFENLISELNTKQIPDDIATFINENIEGINAINNSDKELGKQIKNSQRGILKLIEKELNLVTKNHYRNTWLAIGMVMGIAIGSAIGSSSENTSLLALGIPIGFTIGIAIGTSKDKKAKDNGLQLDIEIK